MRRPSGHRRRFPAWVTDDSRQDSGQILRDAQLGLHLGQAQQRARPSGGVSRLVFKPDWARHPKSALFKRNYATLEAVPIGVIAFPGSAITENLVDKARARRIPVRRYGGDS